MKKSIIRLNIFSIIVSLVFFSSCSEDPVQSLYEIPAGNLPTPIITSIAPSGEALAGVTKITITGSNFVANPNYNVVYFNGYPATILSATHTSIELISPVVISDSVKIKISLVGGNSNFSNEIVYKLKAAVQELYPFDVVTKGEMPYGITVDENENVYVSLADIRAGGSGGLGVKKITSSGVLTNYAPKGSETFFNSLNIHQNDTIFATRRAKGVIQVTENTTPSTFLSSGINQIITDVDFDQYNNLWAVCDSNRIYRIKLDKQLKSFTVSGKARACKIVDDYLYVATLNDFDEKIMRYQIINPDSLSNGEEYYNFSNQISDSIKITDIAFSLDGDLIIGTDRTTDPIFVVHSDKSYEVLYPGLINYSIYSLCWGTDKFLYASAIGEVTLNSVIYLYNKALLKLNMQEYGVQ